MKKGHIFVLLLAAVALSLVVSTFQGASRYVNFAEARGLREANTSLSSVHLIGHLPQDTDGKVWGVEESVDHLSFHFLLIDNVGDTQQVSYPHPMPMDFLRAEQVVVVGQAAKNTGFEAQKILLKCPSKYEKGATAYK